MGMAASVTPVFVSGTSWTATLLIVAGNTNGPVQISIQATDQAGNTGSFSTTTGLTIDTVNPTISVTSIGSNNPVSSTLAKAGDTVTLTFTTGETLSGTPTVTIAGGTYDVRDVDGHRMW